MKLSIALSILILFSLNINGQVAKLINLEWDKIIITDSYGGFYYFNNKYQLNKDDSLLRLVNNPDSTIKKIQPELIDELFNSIVNDKRIKDDPLLIFGRDSSWLINNADELWKKYLNRKNFPREIDSLAINTIKNYNKIKHVVYFLQGGHHWTDDFPYIEVCLVKGTDTTYLTTNGQYPYMLPWKINEKISIYNSNLSKTIAQLLPDVENSNKQRLLGRRFEHHLLDKIYNRFIENEAEFFRAQIKYPKRFTKLSHHFEIIDAEMSFMSSIEWGALLGAPCLELILRDRLLPDNIEFSAVFGRRIFLHPIKPIIRKKSKILDQLKGNPIFEYCRNNSNCFAEIHFVNRKSLSGVAKREFLRDAKENGFKKSTFHGKFKNAIFIEMTEKLKDGECFSRWIFLKDGTLILWELSGDYLMGLPEEYTQENGYICKIIERKELEDMLNKRN